MKHPLRRFTLCICLLAVLLGGCAKGRPGHNPLEQRGGQRTPTGGDLRQQAVLLKTAVAKDPANAAHNYSYGRVLLATDRPREALPYLEKAVAIDPGNIDYLFWQGVAYGENKRTTKERASYERVLQLDRNHLQAQIYLGNTYLVGKNFQTALTCYQRALALSPTNAQALYNLAIVFGHLQRTPEEKLAWRLYLESYPTGELARNAANHLNMLEDFSYRSHSVGRAITLPAIAFKPFSAELTPQSQAALDQIGATVTRLKTGTLDILVYQKNNRDLARKKAISIKTYLENRFISLKTEKRLRLSWFETSEKKKIQGRNLRIDESVVFFLADLPARKKAASPKPNKK